MGVSAEGRGGAGLWAWQHLPSNAGVQRLPLVPPRAPPPLFQRGTRSDNTGPTPPQALSLWTPGRGREGQSPGRPGTGSPVPDTGPTGG